MALIKKMTVVKRTILWLSVISAMWFTVLAFIALEVRERVRYEGLVALENVLHHKTAMLERYTAAQRGSLDDLERLFHFAALHYPIFDEGYWKKPLPEFELVFRDKQNGFYDVFLISPKGDIVHSVKRENDLHTNLTTGPYRDSELARVFKEALKNVRPAISEFRYYEPSRDYAAFLAKPVVVKGTTVGVVAVQIDNKAIHSLINDYRELGRTGEVIAAAVRGGEWIAMAPARHSGYLPYRAMGQPECFPAEKAWRGGNGRRYAREQSGETVAVAWDSIQELGWVIAVSMHEEELLQGWYRLMASLSALFISGVLVIGFLVAVAFRSFNGPIHELTRKAVRIAEGEYEVDIDPSKYDYEWQVLIRGFKQMSQEIRQKIAELAENNDLLKRQKGEIEDLNANLEERIRLKSKKLQEYIDIVDRYVITSQTDLAGVITYVSDAFCRISGYSKGELIGKTHALIRHPDMKKKVFAQMWATIKGGEVWHGEIKNKNADGGYYWVDTTISPMIENGTMVGYMSIRHDITNQKKIEEMAITDAMTGLYNRRHYTKTVQKELNRAKRYRHTVALMMIDVDNFKLYNDTYGHQAGDGVLGRIAAILRHYTSREGEYGFRMGGEEFAVLVGNLRISEYADLAERLRGDVEALKIPHERNDGISCVTISVGIAIWTPETPLSEEELYRKADAQLYLAKEGGRNRVAVTAV